MNRIPKYTAGMFKKKMPRFGASSIRMPRIPKPRIKKFAEGGATGYEEAPPEFEKPKKRTFKEAFRAAKNAGRETFEWRGETYLTHTEEENKKWLDEQGWDIMKNPPYKKMVRKLDNYVIQGKASGGRIRGKGAEIRGKTRGRFV
jgi:hypothetical protein